MLTHEAPNEPAVSLLDLPPTLRQRWSVFAVTAVLFVGFAIVAPIAAIPLAPLAAFVPALQATIFVNDLVTAILLFAQYSIARSRAILVLASGYLFTSLIVVPHALTFPGAFSPNGLLGAGLQSTAWLYYFWHVGAPAAVLVYASLKNGDTPDLSGKGSPVPAIVSSAVVVVGLVGACTWLAIGGERFLPSLFADSVHHLPGTLQILNTSLLLIGGIALVVLWVRRRSLLDYWLVPVVCALILEPSLSALFSSARYSLGFYAGRGFSLITSIVVLAILLKETTVLYWRLARSNIMLNHERDNKLMNIDAITASIAHEVRQPLGAIILNASTTLLLLENADPDIGQIAQIQNHILEDANRANEVFNGIRALFQKDGQSRQRVDLNEIALEVLRSLAVELKQHGIAPRIELASELPPIGGNRGQLKQVILNLIVNAIEAMARTESRRRLLRISTRFHGRDAIALMVEDSGPGFDPKQIGEMFDAFITTKSRGLGLGLAICRIIVERHGGKLAASSDGKAGSTFQFSLPLLPMSDSR